MEHAALHAAGGTDIIVDRYHRSFLSEVALLQRDLAARDEAAEAQSALDVLAEKLGSHCGLQEDHIFPLFERGAACSVSLFEAWIMDALRLFTIVDLLRAAGRAMTIEALRQRVHTLADAIQQHLVAEAHLLSGWTGFTA